MGAEPRIINRDRGRSIFSIKTTVTRGRKTIDRCAEEVRLFRPVPPIDTPIQMVNAIEDLWEQQWQRPCGLPRRGALYAWMRQQGRRASGARQEGKIKRRALWRRHQGPIGSHRSWRSLTMSFGLLIRFLRSFPFLVVCARAGATRNRAAKEMNARRCSACAPPPPPVTTVALHCLA